MKSEKAFPSTLEIFQSFSQRKFEKMAISIFQYQAQHNRIYNKYISSLGVIPEQVVSMFQIPFLPIELFKTQKVLTVQSEKLSGARKKITPTLFLSSGTTGMVRSKHFVFDTNLYEQSFSKAFELFYGDIKKYYLLSFLPSYYSNKNSSLLYMANKLMKRSEKKECRFYKKNEADRLIKTIQQLLKKNKKVILLGVSNALLDLELNNSLKIARKSKNLVVMETGGMKGRKEEVTRAELHKILCNKFGVKKIHSEYGMTELLSQAYSKGDGIYQCPPWMRVLIRDANDPFSYLADGRTGAINIIDFANLHSCSFLATQDVGKLQSKNTFEVLGRLDNSDLRGCSLLS